MIEQLGNIGLILSISSLILNLINLFRIKADETLLMPLSITNGLAVGGLILIILDFIVSLIEGGA